MRVVVGQGSCGVATGARKTAAELEKQIADKGLDIPVSVTGCVGTCYLEPIVDVYDDNDELTRYVKVQPDKVERIVEEHLAGGKPVEEDAISEEDKQFIAKQQRVVLRNCGVINPENIDDYIAVDGYKAIEKVLKEMKPEDVIEEIKVSGLRGRGGAGFPTWFKWNAAKASPGNEKYIVCNADEGDPGAFMDRSVLEGDPHSLLEGMIIGGYAMGACEGIIYCRAEYPLAIKRLEIAMEQAREKGFLGKNIFGSGWDFDIRIKAGAGAFVCGEETALIASLEGERGMPRLKPPFPAAKANCFEAGIHVPMAISYPPLIKRGRRVDDMIGFVDIVPTILELTGVNIGNMPQLCGKSLMKIFKSEIDGKVEKNRRWVFAGRERHSSSRWNNLGYPQRAIVGERYLFIWNMKHNRWPAGAPQTIDVKTGKLNPMFGIDEQGRHHSDWAFTDVDASPTKSFILEHKDEKEVKPYYELAFCKRPVFELYDLIDDPNCKKNLAFMDDYKKIRKIMYKNLLKELKESKDSRVVGPNKEIFDEYRRYLGQERFFPQHEEDQ